MSDTMSCLRMRLLQVSSLSDKESNENLVAFKQPISSVLFAADADADILDFIVVTTGVGLHNLGNKIPSVIIWTDIAIVT